MQGLLKGVRFFMLSALVLAFCLISAGSVWANYALSAGEEAPFLYSIAASWEGKGVARYRIAVQPVGRDVESLKITAVNPVKGNATIATPGATVNEDKISLTAEKITHGKVAMLEYTLLTDAATESDLKPVFAEISWMEDGKELNCKTDPITGEGFIGGGCTAIDKYVRTPELPEYYPAGRDLGILQGSWYEMGVQYGERSGPEIVDFFDYRFGAHLEKYGMKHLLEDISRYEEQAKLFFPEGLEFARGIGDGAAKYLEKSKYHADVSNYLKIVLMNCDNCLFYGHPGNPDADHGLPPHLTSDVTDPAPHGDSCSMIALLGKKGATSDGLSMLVHNNDGDFIDETWRYTYIAIPNTPGANAFWATCSPGKFFDIMGTNNKGVALALTVGGSNTWVPSKNIYERAFGVTWQYILLKALSSVNSAAEALDLLTLGTPEYRAATGRKTLLRTRHNNWIMMDKEEAFVVEVTANRYAVRRPGDYGEKEGFVVATNHYVANHSYDANNERTDFPMTFFGDENFAPQSATRYHTAFWEAMLNYGKMDSEMMKKIWATHTIINKNGERIDQITDGEKWMPAHLASRSICSHMDGYPEKYTGSTIDNKVAIVDYNQVQFALGRPCEYEGMYRTFILR